MDTSIMIAVQRAFDFQFFLEEGLKLCIYVIHYWLVAEKKKKKMKS